MDKVSSTLRVLAFGHVVVTRCELAARIGIVLLLMLRVRRSTACRSHLDIRWHVAHHVLLIVVLLHRVHLADWLPHLSWYNFGMLYSIEACRWDRSLLTSISTISMGEGGGVGTNRGSVWGAQGLPWIEFLRKCLVLLVHHGCRPWSNTRLIYLASIVCSGNIHGMTRRVGPSHYVGMIYTLGFLSLKDIRDVSLVLAARLLQAF